MNDNDLIAGMQQAVKQEVVELYLRERRIIEEEINMVNEAVSALSDSLSAWELQRKRLLAALLTPETSARFAALALMEPSGRRLPTPGAHAAPLGVTRCSRYRRLIDRLYSELWRGAVELSHARERTLRLVREVNGDIKKFELNHDLMGISSFLRSMDPMELTRRKVLGVNFTAEEYSQANQQISFRPLDEKHLGLPLALPTPKPPEEVLPAARDLLDQACRQNPHKVDLLWA